MEDSKVGESDSDFASAESDQGQEELKITASNSPPTTDDVTNPMTSLEDNESPRDQDENADTVQAIVHDNTEETGVNDALASQSRSDEGDRSQVTTTVEQTENKTDAQTTDQHSLTPSEQTISDTTPEPIQPSDITSSAPTSIVDTSSNEQADQVVFLLDNMLY